MDPIDLRPSNAGSDDDEDPILQARHSDPDTSHESMAALDRQQMRRAADVIVALHEEFGPMPDYEQEEHFRRVWPVGCAHLYRQARSIARDQGRIRDSGLRIRNPASGRQQVVWESCEVPPIVIVKCELCGHVLRRRVT